MCVCVCVCVFAARRQVLVRHATQVLTRRATLADRGRHLELVRVGSGSGGVDALRLGRGWSVDLEEVLEEGKEGKEG